jgi:hypothetical protein
MKKNIIRSVQINQATMSAIAQTRVLTVSGDIGSSFVLNVIKINGTGKESYLNFNTRTYSEDFTNKNNLVVTMQSRLFTRVLNFPADANGEVYSITLIASKEKNTELLNGKGVVEKKIVQAGNTNVLLVVEEAFGSVAAYTEDPPSDNITSTGSTVTTSVTTLNTSFTVANAASDAKGFGLMLPDRPASNQFAIPDNYWFVKQSQVTSGTTNSINTVILDSVANLIVGMTLDNVSAGTITTIKPLITAINGNTVTLSSAQSIGNDITLDFRAYGVTLIQRISGIKISFNNVIAKGVPLTKTVRSNTTLPQSDSTVSINLNGTYGIAGGQLVRISGFNVNENGNNNLIHSVTTASATAGTVSISYVGTAADVEAVQIIPIGTVLEIKGSYQVINIEGVATISKYPDSNTKIYLDLGKFITIGEATP